MKSTTPLVAAMAALSATAMVNASATFFEPGETPYLSAADSPFAALDGTWGYSYLEDFEDGALNTPGALASVGTVIGPAFNVDSVDLDDGTLDGWGTAGHSFFVANAAGVTLTFTFDGDTLGGLPTHAGLVWTDGSPVALVTFTAFDMDGASLGSVTKVLGSGPQGSTDEDRFFGASYADGISAIQITTSIASLEVDHLQYGQFSPVPGPSALAALLGFGLLGRRRRRTS